MIPNWTWCIKIGVKLLAAHFTDIKISWQMWTIWTILIKFRHSNFIFFYLILNAGIAIKWNQKIIFHFHFYLRCQRRVLDQHPGTDRFSNNVTRVTTPLGDCLVHLINLKRDIELIVYLVELMFSQCLTVSNNKVYNPNYVLVLSILWKIINWLSELR